MCCPPINWLVSKAHDSILIRNDIKTGLCAADDLSNLADYIRSGNNWVFLAIVGIFNHHVIRWFILIGFLDCC